MTTKSNQTEVGNQYFLRFPMSLSRDWSLSKEWSLSALSKEWSLSSMLDMSLISKEWQSKQSTLDFVANQWCSDNPRSSLRAAIDQPTSEQECQESTTENKTESKKGDTTDWLAMYNNALIPTGTSVLSISGPTLIDTPSPQNLKPKRPSRKVISKAKVYVDQYTDFDVISGRGGRSNHHPGNKAYRFQVREKQSIYRSCEKAREKTAIAQLVVDHVNKNQKGRFLELDTTCTPNRWYLVPNNIARTKVGQALRENNNTKETRAAKRQKYGC